jgi:hypothetical protein
MNAETQEILKEIQATQIIILAKLFDLENQMKKVSATPYQDDKARNYIVKLREHAITQGRTSP